MTRGEEGFKEDFRESKTKERRANIFFSGFSFEKREEPSVKRRGRERKVGHPCEATQGHPSFPFVYPFVQILVLKVAPSTCNYVFFFI